MLEENSQLFDLSTPTPENYNIRFTQQAIPNLFNDNLIQQVCFICIANLLESTTPPTNSAFPNWQTHMFSLITLIKEGFSILFLPHKEGFSQSARS